MSAILVGHLWKQNLFGFSSTIWTLRCIGGIQGPAIRAFNAYHFGKMLIVDLHLLFLEFGLAFDFG